VWVKHSQLFIVILNKSLEKFGILKNIFILKTCQSVGFQQYNQKSE